MLKINTRKFEIEEEIVLSDENDNIIYKFNMQLNADELNKLKSALFNKDTMKLAKKIQNFEKKDLTDEEIDYVLNMSEEMDEEAIKTIEKYCFKEHKERFIELGGEAKYDEMIGVISDYLMDFFMKKAIQRTNTMNTSLKRIGNN